MVGQKVNKSRGPPIPSPGSARAPHPGSDPGHDCKSNTRNIKSNKCETVNFKNNVESNSAEGVQNGG